MGYLRFKPSLERNLLFILQLGSLSLLKSSERGRSSYFKLIFIRYTDSAKIIIEDIWLEDAIDSLYEKLNEK